MRKIALILFLGALQCRFMREDGWQRYGVATPSFRLHSPKKNRCPHPNPNPIHLSSWLSTCLPCIVCGVLNVSWDSWTPMWAFFSQKPFDNLAQKTFNPQIFPKHYKYGFQQTKHIFLKTDSGHETAIFGYRKPQNPKFQLSFLLVFVSYQQTTKITKILKTLFLVYFSKAQTFFLTKTQNREIQKHCWDTISQKSYFDKIRW